MSGFMTNEPVIHRGPIYELGFETDGYRFIPAVEFNGNAGFVGTFALTRNAAGDYSFNLTAAANSPFIAFNINELLSKIGSDPILSLPGITPMGQTGVPGNSSPYPMPAGLGPGTISQSGFQPFKVGTNTEKSQTHLIRGHQLTAITIAYSIATVALTTHSLTTYQTPYVNGSAVAPVTKQATTPIGTATTTNIAVVTIPITTPYIVSNNAAAVADYLEISIVNPGTAVYKLYGIGLSYNYCLL